MKKIIALLFLISLTASSQTGITPLNQWKTNGNAISTNTNFIGSTTNRSLNYATNNIIRGVLGDSLEGRIGVGIRQPTYGIEVSLSKPSFGISGIRATNTNSTGFSIVTARGFTNSASIFAVGPNASVGGAYSNNNMMFACNGSGEFGMVNENATSTFGLYVGGFAATKQQMTVKTHGRVNFRDSLVVGNISTTPLAKLHVVGSVIISSSATITGALSLNKDVIYTATLSLTAAQIKSGANVTIVSAYGAGTYIVPISMNYFYTGGTTPFTSTDLYCQLNGSPVASYKSGAILNSTTNRNGFFIPFSAAGGYDTFVANVDLVITPSAVSAVGDGTCKISVMYRVITSL